MTVRERTAEAEPTPVELIANEIAPELDRLITAFLADIGKTPKSEELEEFLWDNKVGLLRVAQAYGEVMADLRETLRATIMHFGPDGTHKITSHVMSARRARESNAEIDRLEKIFCNGENAKGDGK